MKFICTQDNLIKGLSRVTPVAGKNRQLPILDNVLLRLSNGVLNLTSTDLEVGVYTVVPGKVEDEGGVVVPARKFTDFIQQLPSQEPLQLERDKGVLRVTTKGYKASFATGNEDDFPLLPQKPSGEGVTLPADLFCRALNRTVFAASRDEVRPEIHSVFLSLSEEKVVVAATDSFRLAEDVLEMAESDKDGVRLLVPLNSAQEIVRLFSDQKTITLLPGDNFISIVGAGVEFSSRLVEGKYPDYQQIMPSKFVVEGVVKKDEFSRALKTLSVFLPRDSRRIKFDTEPNNDKIVLQVVGGEAGEGRAEIGFDGNGEKVGALFNIQYLLEGVQHLSGDDVKLSLVGGEGPAVFRSLDKSGGGYTYIVMPIQAN